MMSHITSLNIAIYITFSFLALASSAYGNDNRDPYKSMEHIELDNGVKIIFAPSDSARNVKVKIEVEAGINEETEENWGAAHLLEHVLFRDKDLSDDMSYLQLIKENGGSANGTTYEYYTNYFATISAAKGEWLLDILSKMILRPEIREEYVEKEKHTVELERGRPNPFATFLNFDIKKIFSPPYLRKPSFYESEFNTTFEDKYSITDEQLATRRLTVQEIQKFYNDYYHAKNYRVFISGKFDRQKMLAKIKSIWGALPVINGKVQLPFENPKPRKKPFYRVHRTDTTPYIYAGTKVWDVTARESLILKSYAVYLAHTLMKEIRNKRGQTYSANDSSSIWNRYGYVIVTLQTSKEQFHENLDLVLKHLEDEAERGALADTQVAEAKKLYIDEIVLSGRDADEMMSFADYYYFSRQHFNESMSPLDNLSTVEPAEYNATLRKYFKPEQRYLETYEPALFFTYDVFAIFALICLVTFLILRKVLTHSFDHAQIRWIRKVRYPPLKIFEGLVFFFIVFSYLHVEYALDHALNYFEFIKQTLFLSEYLVASLASVLLIGVAQSYLSFVPRKLMVVGDNLIVKSLSYYSYSIPLADIQSIEVKRPLLYPFPLSLWLGKVKWRYFHFIWRFHRGILITRKDGRAYFFGVKDAHLAQSELQKVSRT